MTPFGVDDALKSAKHAVSLGEAVHGAIPAGIARCSGCLAYINSFCSIKTRYALLCGPFVDKARRVALSGAWICLLCGQSNGAESRYSPQQRHLCPEVASNIVEFDVRPPSARFCWFISFHWVTDPSSLDGLQFTLGLVTSTFRMDGHAISSSSAHAVTKTNPKSKRD